MKVLITKGRKQRNLIFDEETYRVASQYEWRSKMTDGIPYFYSIVNGKERSINSILYRGNIIVHLNSNMNDFSKNSIEILNKSEFYHKYPSQSLDMKSKYYNVSWYEKSKSWKTRMIKDSEIIYERYFSNELDAAVAADFISNDIYGDKGILNFPELSLSQLKSEYERVLDKYGDDRKTIKSKRQQGRKARNTVSRFVGVSYDKRRSTWGAKIKKAGKSHWCGSYLKEEDAAKAYNSKALELFGDNAKLNIIN
jgi:hypothetical protein